jgi:hypothetical protein
MPSNTRRPSPVNRFRQLGSSGGPLIISRPQLQPCSLPNAAVDSLFASRTPLQSPHHPVTLAHFKAVRLGYPSMHIREQRSPRQIHSRAVYPDPLRYHPPSPKIKPELKPLELLSPVSPVSPLDARDGYHESEGSPVSPLSCSAFESSSGGGRYEQSEWHDMSQRMAGAGEVSEASKGNRSSVYALGPDQKGRQREYAGLEAGKPF